MLLITWHEFALTILKESLPSAITWRTSGPNCSGDTISTKVLNDLTA